MKALLIGCGNIGAMYDYKSIDVTSHAKAYQCFGFKVDFIEPRDDLATKIEEKYNFRRKDYQTLKLENYTFVSICTPTQFHTGYLLDAIKAGVPMVICEKPITYSRIELEDLLAAYRKGKTKVLVNYIRRFQKSYNWLKEEINRFNEPLQSIHCNYYKGLMNYASHAMDTIHFLTGFCFTNESIKELKRHYDFFDNDPTISFQGLINDVEFTFKGFKIDYAVFEIDLIFNTHRVILNSGGNEVCISKRTKIIAQKGEMLENYMIDVFAEAKNLLEHPEKKDNFETAVSLNRILIDLVNPNNHE